MYKSRFFLFLFASLLISGSCLAAVPQPESEGKFFPSKGTKSSETYENTAGMPIYDYAKGIQWGPVHLRPNVDYSLNWVDNIFLDEDNNKSDFINRLLARAREDIAPDMRDGFFLVPRLSTHEDGADDHGADEL